MKASRATRSASAAACPADSASPSMWSRSGPSGARSWWAEAKSCSDTRCPSQRSIGSSIRPLRGTWCGYNAAIARAPCPARLLLRAKAAWSSGWLSRFEPSRQDSPACCTTPVTVYWAAASSPSLLPGCAGSQRPGPRARRLGFSSQLSAGGSMRLFFRAGIVVALSAAAAACNKDSTTPVDFDDPAAVSANLSSVDSTFDSDVFRSFTVTTFMLDAATSPAIRPAATLLQTLHPKLARSGAQAFLPGLIQGRKLQMLTPQLSLSAAQGAIIPDSLYGRVYEWNDTTNAYVFRDSTVPNLNGVRFILYAVGRDGQVFEPVTAIGMLDVVDASTQNALQLHVLVRNTAGTTTYVDYTVELTGNATTAQATAIGSIQNGLAQPNHKELSFNETLTVTSNSIRVTAT